MENLLSKYPFLLDDNKIAQGVKEAIEQIEKLDRTKALKQALSYIDLTTLNSTDSINKGAAFAEKVNAFSQEFPELENVAAICVYPPLVNKVKETLTDKSIGIAAVGAGFPSSQTFIEVKTLECKKVVEQGATEVDIVISLGSWLSGNYQVVFNEIKAIKEAIGEAHLKVILETGALPTAQSIWEASIIAMEAGADFIKTSTGKMDPAATPEAAYVMCMAIKAFMGNNTRKIGFKPAGGIVTPNDALTYYSIVKLTLGEEWLNNEYFRLGASRLANNILSELKGEEVNFF